MQFLCVTVVYMFFSSVFFFKQKTAYEMRISDWSSYLCSSDLTVDLQLPKVAFEPTTTKPENVSLSITTESDGRCVVYWNITRVDAKELLDRAVAKLTSDIEKAGGVENMTPEDMPEVHIRGDINTPYRCIGGAVYTMQRAGFAKVGFISEPEPGQAKMRL